MIDQDGLPTPQPYESPYATLLAAIIDQAILDIEQGLPQEAIDAWVWIDSLNPWFGTLCQLCNLEPTSVRRATRERLYPRIQAIAQGRNHTRPKQLRSLSRASTNDRVSLRASELID